MSDAGRTTSESTKLEQDSQLQVKKQGSKAAVGRLKPSIEHENAKRFAVELMDQLHKLMEPRISELKMSQKTTLETGTSNTGVRVGLECPWDCLEQVFDDHFAMAEKFTANNENSFRLSGIHGLRSAKLMTGDVTDKLVSIYGDRARIFAIFLGLHLLVEPDFTVHFDMRNPKYVVATRIVMEEDYLSKED